MISIRKSATIGLIAFCVAAFQGIQMLFILINHHGRVDTQLKTLMVMKD